MTDWRESLDEAKNYAETTPLEWGLITSGMDRGFRSRRRQRRQCIAAAGLAGTAAAITAIVLALPVESHQVDPAGTPTPKPPQILQVSEQIAGANASRCQELAGIGDFGPMVTVNMGSFTAAVTMTVAVNNKKGTGNVCVQSINPAGEIAPFTTALPATSSKLEDLTKNKNSVLLRYGDIFLVVGALQNLDKVEEVTAGGDRLDFDAGGPSSVGMTKQGGVGYFVGASSTLGGTSYPSAGVPMSATVDGVTRQVTIPLQWFDDNRPG